MDIDSINLIANVVLILFSIFIVILCAVLINAVNDWRKSAQNQTEVLEKLTDVLNHIDKKLAVVDAKVTNGPNA